LRRIHLGDNNQRFDPAGQPAFTNHAGGIERGLKPSSARILREDRANPRDNLLIAPGGREAQEELGVEASSVNSRHVLLILQSIQQDDGVLRE
jgi:hypothetical protein